jgi:uncharacterized protein YpmS
MNKMKLTRQQRELRMITQTQAQKKMQERKIFAPFFPYFCVNFISACFFVQQNQTQDEQTSSLQATPTTTESAHAASSAWWGSVSTISSYTQTYTQSILNYTNTIKQQVEQEGVKATLSKQAHAVGGGP